MEKEIICHIHKVNLDICERSLQKIKDHINYAKERQCNAVMIGDLKFWRDQKKKIRIKELKKKHV